jgi:cell wall assembly regulator SMI1
VWRFPDDLKDFFRYVGATSIAPSGCYILPTHSSYAPLGVAGMVRGWRMMMDIWGERPGEVAPAGPLAGTTGANWHEDWIPIGDNSGGDYLFVDLREGPARGCVMEFTKAGACFADPLWPSVTAMLTEIADALEHTTPVLGRWIPTVEPDDGRLFWDYPDEP